MSHIFVVRIAAGNTNAKIDGYLIGTVEILQFCMS